MGNINSEECPQAESRLMDLFCFHSSLAALATPPPPGAAHNAAKDDVKDAQENGGHCSFRHENEEGTQAGLIDHDRPPQGCSGTHGKCAPQPLPLQEYRRCMAKNAGNSNDCSENRQEDGLCIHRTTKRTVFALIDPLQA